MLNKNLDLAYETIRFRMTPCLHEAIEGKACEHDYTDLPCVSVRMTIYTPSGTISTQHTAKSADHKIALLEI
jgi:hypothetical protein